MEDKISSLNKVKHLQMAKIFKLRVKVSVRWRIKIKGINYEEVKYNEYYVKNVDLY